MESSLWEQAAVLPFELHRIRMDPTGRYHEVMDREFPFIMRLFHFRHKDYTPGWTWHERLEVFLPLDGVTRMRMGQQQVELQPGEILIVDNLRLHMTADFPGFESRVIVVSFLPEFVYSLGSPLHDYFFLLPFYFRSSDSPHVVRKDSPLLPQMHHSIGELLRCYFGRSTYYQAGCKAHLLQLLYLLAQQFRSAEVLRSELIRQQERAARLRPVFEYVAQNFSEGLTLKKGSSLANMSQPQFIKLFKRVAGMTLVSYVTHVRLSHAFRLLRESSLTIAEIAFQTGFSDQSHLDRRFKAAFGQVPSAVRKQLNQ
ncbi:MAG: helix-turn-helix transcriptional regulator [Verrucomicrobia bacterium]|nr:helix-turn-helix transcriptional regulator [Verrucomicrobiota bacterium]